MISQQAINEEESMISTVRKHPSYLASILGALALFTLSTTSVLVEARDTAALKALELQ